MGQRLGGDILAWRRLRPDRHFGPPQKIVCVAFVKSQGGKGARQAGHVIAIKAQQTIAAILPQVVRGCAGMGEGRWGGAGRALESSLPAGGHHPQPDGPP